MFGINFINIFCTTYIDKKKYQGQKKIHAKNKKKTAPKKMEVYFSEI